MRTSTKKESARRLEQNEKISRVVLKGVMHKIWLVELF